MFVVQVLKKRQALDDAWQAGRISASWQVPIPPSTRKDTPSSLNSDTVVEHFGAMYQDASAGTYLELFVLKMLAEALVLSGSTLAVNCLMAQCGDGRQQAGLSDIGDMVRLLSLCMYPRLTEYDHQGFNRLLTTRQLLTLNRRA